MSAKGPIAAAELMAMLANDEDYQRSKRERDLELAALTEERMRKLALFTADISAAGIHATYDPRTGNSKR